MSREREREEREREDSEGVRTQGERNFSQTHFFTTQQIENIKKRGELDRNKSENRKQKIEHTNVGVVLENRNTSERREQFLTKIFVGNLPPEMDHVWFRNLFTGFGRISRLFVSFKTNRFGRKFGFASFFRKQDAVEAIRLLNQSWVADGRIRVCFARSFSRDNLGEKDRPKVQYMNEVVQKPLVSYSTNPEDLEWLQRSLVGHIKYPEAADILVEKLLVEIPFNVTLTMISAAMMLITFENQEDRNLVIEEGAYWLSEAFDNAEIWSPKLICTEKFVRIRIEGIPLHAWNNKFFAALCESWGSLVKIDEDVEARNRLDCCHLIVRINTQKLIPSKASIQVDGEMFEIQIIQENHEYVGPIVLRKSNQPALKKSLVNPSFEVNLVNEKENSQVSLVQDSQISGNIQGNNIRGEINIQIPEFAQNPPNVAHSNLNLIYSDGINVDVNKPLQICSGEDSSPEIPPGFENRLKSPISSVNFEVNAEINSEDISVINTPSMNNGLIEAVADPPQIISNSQPLRRSARRSKSKFRKVLFDLDGLNKDNCKENKLPTIAEDILSTGMQLGMRLVVPIEEATRNIESILEAEASRELIVNL